MKSFEEEVGFPLLIKTNRGVEPTNEARSLLPSMRQLIKCEEKVDQEIAEIMGIRRGTIRMGSFVSTSVHWVPLILEYFQNHYPEVEFQIEELGHDELVSGLVDGSLDIALMSKPERSSTSVRKSLIIRYQCYKLSHHRIPVSGSNGSSPVLSEPSPQHTSSVKSLVNA